MGAAIRPLFFALRAFLSCEELLFAAQCSTRSALKRRPIFPHRASAARDLRAFFLPLASTARHFSPFAVWKSWGKMRKNRLLSPESSRLFFGTCGVYRYASAPARRLVHFANLARIHTRAHPTILRFLPSPFTSRPNPLAERELRGEGFTRFFLHPAFTPCFASLCFAW